MLTQWTKTGSESLVLYPRRFQYLRVVVALIVVEL